MKASKFQLPFSIRRDIYSIIKLNKVTIDIYSETNNLSIILRETLNLEPPTQNKRQTVNFGYTTLYYLTSLKVELHNEILNIIKPNYDWTSLVIWYSIFPIQSFKNITLRFIAGSFLVCNE